MPEQLPPCLLFWLRGAAATAYPRTRTVTYRGVYAAMARLGTTTVSLCLSDAASHLPDNTLTFGRPTAAVPVGHQFQIPTPPKTLNLRLANIIHSILWNAFLWRSRWFGFPALPDCGQHTPSPQLPCTTDCLCLRLLYAPPPRHTQLATVYSFPLPRLPCTVVPLGWFHYAAYSLPADTGCGDLPYMTPHRTTRHFAATSAAFRCCRRPFCAAAAPFHYSDARWDITVCCPW